MEEECEPSDLRSCCLFKVSRDEWKGGKKSIWMNKKTLASLTKKRRMKRVRLKKTKWTSEAMIPDDWNLKCEEECNEAEPAVPAGDDLDGLQRN